MMDISYMSVYVVLLEYYYTYMLLVHGYEYIE